ncbi:Quinidine resistance protein 1 [Escovopsis weberi]|uniref:Quinidine resistance protein 1 n=1 Tax=Escovopsis weberi TaxID=150374 RepID=A0A0M8N4F8_ESCWE|nr:Quinidine resistance protein 1 [Escovopsis weberi]
MSVNAVASTRGAGESPARDGELGEGHTAADGVPLPRFAPPQPPVVSEVPDTAPGASEAPKALEAPDTPDSASKSPASPGATAAVPFTIFDKPQKALIVFLVSTAATFSGFASNIYFPALPTVARDFNVSPELINLTVTSYLIFQGLAPSLWGPVSDVKGRRVAYLCTFTVFTAACIGLALSKNYATLLVLRCLQSTGSASTIAIGAGVIGDITTREERGGVMGIFQAGLLAPVALGPVIGGALTGSLGWRSVFWFITIYSGVFLCFLVALLPETLRSIVANGSRTPGSPVLRYPLVVYQRLTKVRQPAQEGCSPPPDRKKKVDVTGPIRILVSRGAPPMILFMAVHYAVWQMGITAMSTLFEDRYGLGETQIGLTFIANGAGSIIGTFLTGRFLDMDYRRFKARHEAQRQLARAGGPAETTTTSTSGEATASKNTVQGGDDDDDDDSFPIKRARLRLAPVFSVLQCLFVILFGWAIQYHAKISIAVPIICTFVMGWTAISTQSTVMTYLVDIFPDRSAAASASLNLARCLFAAGGTSVVMPLVNGIGVGWTFTICAGVQFLVLMGLLVIN